MERAHRSASPLTPMSLSSEYASDGPFGPSALDSSISIGNDEHDVEQSREDFAWALHNDLHEEDMETPTPKTASEKALAP